MFVSVKFLENPKKAEGNMGKQIPFHIAIIVVVVMDERVVRMESTFVRKSEHWHVSGQKMLDDLHVTACLWSSSFSKRPNLKVLCHCYLQSIITSGGP